MDDGEKPTNARQQPHGALLEKFTTPGSRIIGIGALVLAGLILVDAALNGWSVTGLLIVAASVLAATIAWTVLVRPAVVAYERALLVRNLASDLTIPWHLIDGATMAQTLRISTRGGTIHAVGVGKSSRQVLRGSMAGPGPAPAVGSLSGTPSPPGSRYRFGEPAVSRQDYVAERVMLLAMAQREASLDQPAVQQRWAVVELTVLALSALAVVLLLVLR